MNIKEFKIQIKPGDNTFAVEFKIASDGDPISAENWIGDSFPIDTMSIEIDEIITKEEVKSINHYFAFNDSFSNIKFISITKDAILITIQLTTIYYCII